MIIKITLPAVIGNSASLTTQDGAFKREIHVTRVLLAKFPIGSRAAYFKASISEKTETLDIDDLIEGQSW